MYIQIPRDAIFRIFGIEKKVGCEAEEMARSLTITFFPHNPSSISKNVKTFAEELEKALRTLGVTIVAYEEALQHLPIRLLVKLYVLRIASIFLFPFRMMRQTHTTLDRFHPRVVFGVRTGRKIKKGISVIALGEGKTGALPIDFTMSFSKSNVVTILDMPSHITSDTEFHEHFDTMMGLFTRHMTNVAIVVDDASWIPYNFNASHPRFPRRKDFARHVLFTLIPKIAAPISPPRLSEFIVEEHAFDVNDSLYKPFVSDFIESGLLFEKTKLYPPGKLLDDLPFRNDFYRWAGKIHLDERNGMSYGFLARQLPVKPSPVLTEKEASLLFGPNIKEKGEEGCVFYNGKLFIRVMFHGEQFFVEVPEVWVLSQRSGSHKTRMNPKKDFVMLGLVGGKMILRTPQGLLLHADYKPSFDTRVILAHAIGNAVIASFLKEFRPHWEFWRVMEKNGAAIAHWHGYINPDQLPEGWWVHGAGNPRVPCSSLQSVVYALEGKMGAFSKSMEEGKEYKGDVHIEPDHGTNIVFPTLKELAEFVSAHSNVTRLGNHYFSYYEHL